MPAGQEARSAVLYYERDGVLCGRGWANVTGARPGTSAAAFAPGTRSLQNVRENIAYFSDAWTTSRSTATIRTNGTADQDYLPSLTHGRALPFKRGYRLGERFLSKSRHQKCRKQTLPRTARAIPKATQ